MRIVITCEHAGNKVPAAYKSLFISDYAVLKTHEAYDIGAAEAARILAAGLSAPFFLSSITRLIIDVNRSIGHPSLFSRFSRMLDRQKKNLLLERYYRAFRVPVENLVKSSVEKGELILHVSVHSFTPVLHRRRRNTDIGLLYDPSREKERLFCNLLKRNIYAAEKDFRVRLNYPYQGISDSMVTFLRKQLPPVAYIGVELEINQKILGDSRRWLCLKPILQRAFLEVSKRYDS